MIIQGVLILVLAYLAFSVIYQLLLSVAGHFPKKKNELKPAQQVRKTAVFIPAYKEDSVILPVVQEALRHDYPEDKREIVVIADSLKAKTVEALNKLPIQLIEVAFEKSTKAKALNVALEQLDEQDFDIAVVLDADNIMAPGFLYQINQAFERGHQVVQGQRTPKNQDSPMAILDGAAEAINNHLLCRGASRLGLSARLAGSGMAFDYRLFRSIMPDIDAIGGFDKELELKLTREGYFLVYEEKAIVLDEKVSNGKQFARQRSRWIAAQYTYLSRFFWKGCRALVLEGKRDFFHKVIQQLLPPRVLLPTALLLGTLTGVLINPFSSWTLAFLVLFLANISTFFLALPMRYFQWPTIKGWLYVGLAVFYTLKALLGISKARKAFLHTSHNA
jgi:cellulose synthase/poly-beta-1,6-N-acetylglucosamine synthase-like glycosyltransferase